MPLSHEEFSASFALHPPAPLCESNIAAMRSAFKGHEYTITYFVRECILLFGLAVIVFPLLLPLYLLGLCLWGRPPRVTPFSECLLYLRHAVFFRSQQSKIPFLKRIDLLLIISKRCFAVPIIGVCWFIDELLYGNELSLLQIKNPVFVIS